MGLSSERSEGAAIHWRFRIFVTAVDGPRGERASRAGCGCTTACMATGMSSCCLPHRGRAVWLCGHRLTTLEAPAAASSSTMPWTTAASRWTTSSPARGISPPCRTSTPWPSRDHGLEPWRVHRRAACFATSIPFRAVAIVVPSPT